MSNHEENDSSAGSEWLTFLLITFVIMPLVSIGIVGGYGFFVWMMQIFFWGPPTGH